MQSYQSFSAENDLFGTVKLVINPIKSILTYNGRGIAFDGEGFWNFDNDSAKNVVIFGVDDSLSSHTDNWKNIFLVLGKVPTFCINGSDGAAEKNLVLTIV